MSRAKTEALKNAAFTFFTILGVAALIAAIVSVHASHGRVDEFSMSQFWYVFCIGLGAAIAKAAYIYFFERD